MGKGIDVNSELLSQILNRNDTIIELLTALNERAPAQHDMLNTINDSVNTLGATIGQSIGSIINTSNINAFQTLQQMEQPAVDTESFTTAPVADQQTNTLQQEGDTRPSSQEITTVPDIFDVNVISFSEQAEKELSGLFDFTQLSPGTKDKPAVSIAQAAESAEREEGILNSLGKLITGLGGGVGLASAGVGVGVGAATAGTGYGAGQVLKGGGSFLEGAGKGIGGVFKGIGQGIGSIFGFGGNDEAAAVNKAPVRQSAVARPNMGKDLETAVRSGTIPIVMQLIMMRRDLDMLKRVKQDNPAKEQPEEIKEAKHKIINERIENVERKIELVEQPPDQPRVDQKTGLPIAVESAVADFARKVANYIALDAPGKVRRKKPDEVSVTTPKVTAIAQTIDKSETMPESDAPSVAQSADKAEPMSVFEKIKSVFGYSIKEIKETNTNKEVLTASSVPQKVKDEFVDKSVTRVKDAQSDDVKATSSQPESKPEKKQSFWEKAKSFAIDKGNSIGSALVEEYNKGSGKDKESESTPAVDEEYRNVQTQRFESLMDTLKSINTNIGGMRQEFPEAIASIPGGGSSAGASKSSGDSFNASQFSRISSQRDLNRSA